MSTGDFDFFVDSTILRKWDSLLGEVFGMSPLGFELSFQKLHCRGLTYPTEHLYDSHQQALPIEPNYERKFSV
jgi:hypothetical protein